MISEHLLYEYWCFSTSKSNHVPSFINHCHFPSLIDLVVAHTFFLKLPRDLWGWFALHSEFEHWRFSSWNFFYVIETIQTTVFKQLIVSIGLVNLNQAGIIFLRIQVSNRDQVWAKIFRLVSPKIFWLLFCKFLCRFCIFRFWNIPVIYFSLSNIFISHKIFQYLWLFYLEPN